VGVSMCAMPASSALCLRAALAAAALPLFGFLNFDWIARKASAQGETGRLTSLKALPDYSDRLMSAWRHARKFGRFRAQSGAFFSLTA
jgi:hypothetical protein